MKRSFSSPPAQELLTRGKSHGGSYRLDNSTALILEARRLKRQASDSGTWTPFILETLSFAFSLALAMSFLFWVALTGNDEKAASVAFSAMLLTFCGLVLSVVAIVVRNRFVR
jgi:hypothetical protein